MLGLASLASFIVILDVMVVATALTAIRRDLGASLAELEWTVNAYTLSFAVLLMTAAALGDRLGRRRVFAAGLMMFAVSSAGCALAPDAATLIAARAVQGAGAATDHADGASAAERRVPARAARLGDRDLRRHDRAGRGGRAGARRRGHPGTRLAVDLLAQRADRAGGHPAGPQPDQRGNGPGRRGGPARAGRWSPPRRWAWCGGWSGQTRRAGAASR